MSEYEFRPGEEPEDDQRAFDRTDPRMFAFMGADEHVAAAFAGQFFFDMWKTKDAAKREEKGLPEKRRSPIQWAKDGIVIWQARKRLKTVDITDFKK